MSQYKKKHKSSALAKELRLFCIKPSKLKISSNIIHVHLLDTKGSL